MVYQFQQNNSGGVFVVNDMLCHRLFIEARDANEAVHKAEELGCYWNGVEEGIDCPCCGDRWSQYSIEPVPLYKYAEEGYEVSVYDNIYHDTIAEWGRRYGMFECVVSPEFKPTYSSRVYTGKIRFRNVEEYAQFLANEYGWTTPDARIFYMNGTIKEIFKQKG